MQHVTLIGKDYRVPPACACCSEPTEEMRTFEKNEVLFLLVVLITKKASVTMPYCRPCREHATWSKGGGWLGVGLLGVLAFVLSWFLGFVLAFLVEALWAGQGFVETTKGVLLALTVAVAGTALAVWLRARKRPRGPLPRKHATEKWAVEVVSFDKRRTRLRLDSLPFAKAFLEINPGVALRG